MEISGRITKIKNVRGEKKVTIANQGKDVTISMNNYWIMEGDLIHCRCDKNLFLCDKPVILPFTDGMSVMECISWAIYHNDTKEKDRYPRSRQKGRILFKNIRKESNDVIKYLSKKADDLQYLGKSVLDTCLPHMDPMIDITDLERVLIEWSRKYLERRLILLGLSEQNLKELKIFNLTFNDAYDRIMLNPYTVLSIPDDVCDSICATHQIIIDMNTRLISKKLRLLYILSKEAGINAIPLQLAKDRYNIMDSDFKILRKDFRCYIDDRFIFLEHQNIMRDKFLTFMKSANDEVRNITPRNISNLDKDQILAIENCGKKRITCITGGPGTGKTTLITSIVEMFKDNKLTYAILSFTGKAVSRIKEVFNDANMKTTMTINRFITSGENYNAIILDEASMVSLPLFCNLIDRIPKSRLICIGDKNQLQPIGPGTPFTSMLMKDLSIFHLTTDHRRKKSDINVCLTNIKRGSDLGQGKDYSITYNSSISKVCERIKLYIKVGIKIDKITVITALNVDVNKINDFFISEIKPLHHVIDKNGKKFFVGQRVMMTENNKKYNIYNGLCGKVTEIDENHVGVLFSGLKNVIDFPLNGAVDEEDELFTTDLLVNAWALTVHKSQGSEFKYCIFYLPETRMARKELIYTAASRAKKRLDIITSMNKETFMQYVKKISSERFPKALL